MRTLATVLTAAAVSLSVWRLCSGPCAVPASAAAEPANAAPVAPAAARSEPPSPAEILSRLQLPVGLRAELVAAEPLIRSPVAIAFDEDGRLWVVEMPDYPNGPSDATAAPGGRIRVLEDRDGDGRFETARTFAEGLLMANGVLPWRGGAIVTVAPKIVHLYNSRSDRDAPADVCRTLFEGFATGNPQLRVSFPAMGFDGWITVANGLRGGSVAPAGVADAVPIALGGRDFRFDPATGRFELDSGPGQFGNSFDDWGRRFVCDNRHALRHVVLSDRLLRRHAQLTVPATVQDVPAADDGPLSSGIALRPISKNWTTSSLHVGRLTAGCGVLIEGGGLLPPPWRGVGLTCDPTGNLVHAETLTPTGASFRSTATTPDREFAASPDDWFRPVSLALGPDGALYVVDMCRAVIEHPEFMPAELKARPDLLWGRDHGRIWRIVPTTGADGGPYRHVPFREKWSAAGTTKLVAELASPNRWRRTTAHRLLLDRPDCVEPLLAVIADAAAAPLAVVHAAWLLDRHGRLSPKAVVELLRHPHPRVREQAAQLAERQLGEPGVAAAVAALADDPDPAVQFAAAVALGAIGADDADSDPNGRLGKMAALVKIAAHGAGDPWRRAAVLAAVAPAGQPVALLRGVLGKLASEVRDDDVSSFAREIAVVIGTRRQPTEIANALRTVLIERTVDDGRNVMVVLAGLAEGLARRGARLADVLTELPRESADVAAAARSRLTESARTASDPTRTLADRREAIRLLAHAPGDAADPVGVLAGLLSDEPEAELRLLAVRALSARPEPTVAERLLAGWRGFTPPVRREVIEALLSRAERVPTVLDALAEGRLRPSDLDPTAVRRLTTDRRPEIAQRAAKLLASAVPADRRAVLEAYRPALARAGDAARGREVFAKNCAACHRIAGVGHVVGPDISDLRTKTPEMLLSDILNPNAAIDANYTAFAIRTSDERVLTGLVAADTAAGVVLRRAEGVTDTLPRSEIAELRSTGQSLMPEGVEKSVSVEQMADLIAYLKGWRYLTGSVPGR